MLDAMTTEEEGRQEKRERVAAMFSKALGPGWRIALAYALERDRAAIRRTFAPPKGRNDAPSAELESIAEFLTVTPRKYWPSRWHNLPAE